VKSSVFIFYFFNIYEQYHSPGMTTRWRTAFYSYFNLKKTIPQNGDEDDMESSGGEETVEGAAGAQDSGREEGEEEEERLVHPKSRTSVLSRTKRNRLVCSLFNLFLF
jgi:hypothetical protein